MEFNLYKIKSAILGHAIGDALGVPVEFTSREEREREPVTQMIGYGIYPYPAGTWSDDTSMTIATLDSLIHGIDYEDIMIKFCQWFDEAKYTANNEVFDIGNATRKSLLNYMVNNIAALDCGQKSEWDNGNGALMRIAPVVLYFSFSKEKEKSMAEKIECIEKVSSLTHGHPRSLIACGIYAFILFELLNNPDKVSIFSGIQKSKKFYSGHCEYVHYERIFEDKIKSCSENEVSGSGYVVNCLEAALWCLITTESYRDCVLKAINLGEDTDTTAAIAGGLAGVLYGYNSIPEEWLNTLKRRDYIEALCVEAESGWKNENV